MPEPTCEARLPLAVVVDTFTAGGGMGDQCVVWMDALSETLRIESGLIRVSCQIPGLCAFAKHHPTEVALPSRPFVQIRRLEKNDPTCSVWIVSSHGIISLEVRSGDMTMATIACGSLPIERKDPLQQSLREAIQVHAGESNG